MISVVVPCYFKDESFIDMTNKCLKTMGKLRQIIVVDDGSPLKYVVPKHCEKVVRHENGGYAKAVNTGLERTTGSVIIICNNDIEFIQPDWLEHLLNPLDEYGICSIRTTDADGWETEDRLEENAKFGSIWAITREAFEKIGYLDDSFGKGYFEDLDYWHRAQEAGVKIVKNHAGLVEHKGRATFKTLDDVDMIYNEAMIRYAEKHPDSYLLSQNGGVVLMDYYESLDMPEPARKKARELSMTVKEARKLLWL